MTEYNDFRVVLSPSLHIPGAWDVLLTKSPVQGADLNVGCTQLVFTQAELARLRNRNGWPSPGEMRDIGKSVWTSLMTPQLEPWFASSLKFSLQANRGMRLFFCMLGEQPQDIAPGAIHLQELPVEALYSDLLNYLAQNPLTPISRSLRGDPDVEPLHVALPLRILAVVATPTDKPKADVDKENRILQDALRQLTGPGGAVELEFCEPPTRLELSKRLQSRRYQILHFAGHGTFDFIGNDPSPQAHLCFEDDNHQSALVDAETFETLLQNSDIHLVVLTACASAQPTPDEVQASVGPFAGLAQKLVAGISGVSAVVAMQFDMESRAALTFTRRFYTQLLSSGSRLDEVVAQCRKDLIADMGVGHRAWITPVVYWRCKDGRVFDIDPMSKTLDPAVQKQLLEIDVSLEVYKGQINWVKTQSPEVQAALAALVQELQKKIEELLVARGQFLGETLRLRGGTVKAGEVIPCRLAVRLRTPSTVGDVSLHVRYPAEKVKIGAANPGKDVPGVIPMTGLVHAGELTLSLHDVSQGAQWAPGEFELATVDCQVRAGVTDPLIELTVSDCQVYKEGQPVYPDALSAVLFVE